MKPASVFLISAEVWQNQLYKAPEKLETVEDDYKTADNIDNAKSLVVEFRAEKRNDRCYRCKPDNRCACKTSRKQKIRSGRERCLECTEHHLAVD